MADQLDASFAVTDRVVRIKDGRAGQVKYVGEVDRREGVWIGVVLDEPDGPVGDLRKVDEAVLSRWARSGWDGTLDGQFYFQCPKGYGTVVRPEELQHEKLEINLACGLSDSAVV